MPAGNGAEVAGRPGELTGRNRFLSVLRVPDFMIFTVSQAVSLFGDKLDYMALLAMVAFLSARFGWASARAISFLTVIVALPVVLFGPLAGILVDRWDRRKVMLVADSARTVLVLFVPLVALRTDSLALVYLVAFTVFLFGLFFNTARLAIIPNLVGPDRLLAANSLMSLVGRVATFFGMLLGGLIVDWRGWLGLGIRPVWTAGFYIDALSYLVSVAAILVIYRRLALARPPARPLATAEGARSFAQTAAGRVRQLLAELREAARLVAREPSVLFVYCSVLVLVVVGAAMFVLYVPIVQNDRTIAGLGLGTRGVGFVAAIGSIGLVVSSMSYGLLGHRVRKHRVMLCAFLVLGLVAGGLALARSFAVVAPLVFVAGLALSPIFIGMDTMIHESAPEQARGRVFASRDWLMHLLFALAALLIGQLTHFFAVRHLLLAVGGLVSAASIAGVLLCRGRNIG